MVIFPVNSHFNIPIHITENVKGYVNGIYTTDGGTHVTGFRIALTRAITDYYKRLQNGNSKDESQLTGDDMKEGLTAIVYVKMPSETLQFEIPN